MARTQQQVQKATPFFRVLSLIREAQDGVDVVKPILEELEVLKLSCAVGALPHDLSTFAGRFVQASDFDDDLVRLLQDDDSERTNVDVFVTGVLGRQPQVQAHLEGLGVWDSTVNGCNVASREEFGLYAAMEPATPDTKHQVVTMFAWLGDEFFAPNRLRETTAHVLRMLTALTNQITCCLSDADARVLEEATHCANQGATTRNCNAYTAGFVVAKQQDARDDVDVSFSHSVPLAQWPTQHHRVGLLRGSFAAVMTIVSAPGRVRRETFSHSFRDTALFADWLDSHTSKFRVSLSVKASSDAKFQESLLKRFGFWPSEALCVLEQESTASAKLMEDACTQDAASRMASILATMERVATDWFRTASAYGENDSSQDFVHAWLTDLAGPGPVYLSHEQMMELYSIFEIPVVLKYLLHMYCGGQEMSMLLSMPVFQVIDAAIRWDHAHRSWVQYILSPREWFRESRPCSSPEFELAVEPFITRWKERWMGGVRELIQLKNREQAMRRLSQSHQQLHDQAFQQRQGCIHSAYQAMLSSWHQADRGLASCVEVVRSRDGRITCRGDIEIALDASLQARFWSLQDDTANSCGAFVLDINERIVQVFTILTRSFLIVSVGTNRSTIKIFHGDSPRGGMSVRSIRELNRVIIVCDFDIEERMLVVASENGDSTMYRLDERYRTMEPVVTLDLLTKTNLEMPLRDVCLAKGTLHLVDDHGTIQSFNTRNLQCSRPISVVPQGAGHLFHLWDGQVLAWCEEDQVPGASDLQSKLCFIAADDGRQLPASVHPVGNEQDALVQICNNQIWALDPSHGVASVGMCSVTLQSDSFCMRAKRVGSRKPEAVSESELSASALVGSHWLWAFYHLFEKFPVRGAMEPAHCGPDRAMLSIAFVASECCGGNAKENVEAGGQCVLARIMQRLRDLHKPLYGMDISTAPVQICRFGEQKISNAQLHAVTELLRGLATCVPVQICRGELNALTLMCDGQRIEVCDEAEQGAVDIARSLRFGILSPLLSAWRGRCIVISSMGKQSTGKSYFLNHLTGTSFATAGARCTDGAWMSVCELANGVMLVVLDFEGIGSFERSKQEDVFLSVLNAAVSMLTVFRMEMRLDKEFDELFSKFQQGSQLIPSDPQLFRGKLSMSVKDVNPHDVEAVVDEFVSKCGKLLHSTKDHNFLTDMYAGQLDIHCSPPLGTSGYYDSLAHVQATIESEICGDSAAGFASGKVYLDCVRLILSKISILDWTSVDEGAAAFKLADATQVLPGLVRFGKLLNGEIQSASAIENPSVDTVCHSNPRMAEKWLALQSARFVDTFPDKVIDLGFSGVDVNGATVATASLAIQQLFSNYMATEHPDASVAREFQEAFDVVLSFLVHRRCIRVQNWSHEAVGGSVPDAWRAAVQRHLWTLHAVVARCSEMCSECLLGCVQSTAHCSNGGTPHDCGTSHVCPSECSFCVSSEKECEGTSRCAKPAGHEGGCECAEGDHSCGKPCGLAASSSCGRRCARKIGHEDDDHRCDVRIHECGQPCEAPNCARLCVADNETAHTVHKCSVSGCVSPCMMDECHRTCSSSDHFHGSDVDGDDSTVVHLCGDTHACGELCVEPGICHIDVVVKRSTETFAGTRGSFQYTAQEMNGSRKTCVMRLAPGMMSHEGPHTCAEWNDSHYCEERCPCCSYYCQRDHGHEGKHKTTHGNMRSTVFLSDERNLDVLDRKYTVGERGTAEMCSLYCSKMGRGHVHYLDCEQGSQASCVFAGTTASTDQRRHCTRQLMPPPERAQDEVLHERFWDTFGWMDPSTQSDDRASFALCPFHCSAPEHKQDGRPSYCVLPAWHEPASRSERRDGFLYSTGHKLTCSHIAKGTKRHFVFVLEEQNMAQHIRSLRSELQERIGKGLVADLVSVITFGNAATIYCERKPILGFTTEDETVLLRGSTTGSTATLLSALREASTLLSRSDSRTYGPVLCFFWRDEYGGRRRASCEIMIEAILKSVESFQSSVYKLGSGAVGLVSPISKKLGWVQVDDIDTILHSVSTTEGSKSGLAVAASFAEEICVICQRELSAEAAFVPPRAPPTLLPVHPRAPTQQQAPVPDLSMRGPERVMEECSRRATKANSVHHNQETEESLGVLPLARAA